MTDRDPDRQQSLPLGDETAEVDRDTPPGLEEYLPVALGSAPKGNPRREPMPADSAPRDVDTGYETFRGRAGAVGGEPEYDPMVTMFSGVGDVREVDTNPSSFQPASFYLLPLEVQTTIESPGKPLYDLEDFGDAVWRDVCSNTVYHYLQGCQQKMTSLSELIDSQSMQQLNNIMIGAVRGGTLSVSQAGTVNVDHTVLHEMIQYVIRERRVRITVEEVTGSLTRALCQFAVAIRKLSGDLKANEIYLRILVVSQERREITEVHSLGRQAKYLHYFSPAHFPEIDNDTVQGRQRLNTWMTTLGGPVPYSHAVTTEIEERVSEGSEKSEDRSEETLRQSVISSRDRPEDGYLYDDEQYKAALETVGTWMSERDAPQMASTPAEDELEGSLIMPVTSELEEASRMPLRAMGTIANSIGQERQSWHARMESSEKRRRDAESKAIDFERTVVRLREQLSEVTQQLADSQRINAEVTADYEAKKMAYENRLL